MQNYAKWVLGPRSMTHPPQIKNWGGNFATHVIPGTNCAKLNVPLAPHNKLHKLQKDANRAKNEHKMQIAFTMTVLTQDMHAMLGIQITFMFKHFEAFPFTYVYVRTYIVKNQCDKIFTSRVTGLFF